MVKTGTDNYTILTRGPVGKAVMMMALPAVISMLVTSLYNVITTFYVGRISTQATAAVGICFSFMSILQAIAFMFGQGSGTFISRELGAKRQESSGRMASLGFFLSVITGIVLAAAGLLLLEPLSVLLGSTPTVLPDTKIYLRYILLATPFIMGAIVLNNQMRFQGNARYAMWGIISGTLVNVILAPVLIFSFGMGIRGAGIATLAGQAFSFFMLLVLTRRGGNVRIRISNFRNPGRYFGEIFTGGSPSLVRQGLASVSIALLNNAAAMYGDAAIAAMSIVARISFIFAAVVIGLGHGFQPMCGFSYGAGLYGRVKKGYAFVVKAGTAFMLACAVLGYLFPSRLVAFFRNDPEVIAIGVDALRWQMYTIPLVPLIMYSNMLLQTTRHALGANVLAASRNGLFFIPAIIVLPMIFGLTGVMCAQCVSDVLSFVLAIIIVSNFFRKLGTDPVIMEVK